MPLIDLASIADLTIALLSEFQGLREHPRASKSGEVSAILGLVSQTRLKDLRESQTRVRSADDSLLRVFMHWPSSRAVGQDLVEHYSEGVDVRFVGEARGTVATFGGHVGYAATAWACVSGRTGKSEVGDNDVGQTSDLTGEPEITIVALDIAMDDPVRACPLVRPSRFAVDMARMDEAQALRY